MKLPEKCFLPIGITFGLLFLLITPPFQVPDEINHFYRAYQVSEGRIIGERNGNAAGGFLPRRLPEMAGAISQGIMFHPERKQKLEYILHYFNQPLDIHNRVFVSFANTSILYSPVPYFSQASGIFLGRLLHLPPIILFYFGRVFNLFAWAFLMYYAIRITPIFKWVFFLLALTPMSLFEAASLSADSFTNGIAFLLIAAFLRCAFNEHFMLGKHIIPLLYISSILLALSKPAYFIMSALFLLIPQKKIGRKGNYVSLFLLILASSFIAIFLWWCASKGAPLSFQRGASPHDQMRLLLAAPLKYPRIILKSFLVDWRNYVDQFVGVLGWLDTPLPPLFTRAYFAVLILVSLLDARGCIRMGIWRRCLIGFTFVSNALIMMTMVYIGWTTVGTDFVQGIQGRYFIPISPLLFLLMYNTSIPALCARMPCHTWLKGIIPRALILFSICSLVFALCVLFQRYYGERELFTSIPKQVRIDEFEKRVLNRLSPGEMRDAVLNAYRKDSQSDCYVMKEDLTDADKMRLVEALSAAGYKYTALHVSTFHPSNSLRYTEKGQWQELVCEAALAIPRSSLIRIVITCQNAAHSDGVRILFDGIGGHMHHNYWYYMYRPAEGDNMIELSPGDFFLGNGEMQWDTVRNIQLGGSGNPPFAWELKRFEIISANGT